MKKVNIIFLTIFGILNLFAYNTEYSPEIQELFNLCNKECIPAHTECLKTKDALKCQTEYNACMNACSIRHGHSSGVFVS